MNSVLQTEKECWVCKREYFLEEHHIYYGYSSKNRANSEKLGLKVWLCLDHHRDSKVGVHFNKALDLRLKQMAQAYYEANIDSRESFIQTFGRNYL